MKIASVATALGVAVSQDEDPISVYQRIRGHYFNQYFNSIQGVYQSPSYADTPLIQTTDIQSKRRAEVYLRYDFDPAELESRFNKGHQAVDGVSPRTLFFSSGMSAITTLLLYLARAATSRRACIGLHSYFETVRLLRQLFRLEAQEEAKLNIKGDAQILWMDYPLSTEWNEFPDLSSILKRFRTHAIRHYDRDFFAVIDYSVAAFAFDIRDHVSELPENVHLLLISSLQKHMGYGLDLARGGAITIYSRSPELPISLARLRTYSGSCLTETSFYLMPPVIPSLIKDLVKDAGMNARRLAEAVANLSVDGLRLHYPPQARTPFETSLIFLEIDDRAARSPESDTYPADSLLQYILSEARSCHAPVTHGESFGFAMTRIHKWGPFYSDVRSVRICAGYDEQLAEAAIEPILAGIISYANSIGGQRDLRNAIRDVTRLDISSQYDGSPANYGSWLTRALSDTRGGEGPGDPTYG